MDSSKESVEKALKEEKLLKAITKRTQRMARMNQEMSASGIFKRTIIFLKYLWLDLFVFVITLTLAMSILGFIAKTVWTIWTMIFQIDL